MLKFDPDTYIHEGGVRCPYCRSCHIEGREVTINSGSAFQKMGCNDCNQSWTDEYILVRVWPWDDEI